MQRLFTLCAVAYLLIYAFEGVIRYGLYSVGANSVILLRDGLILGPLLILLVAQACRTRVHPAYFVFAAIVGLHGIISTLNFHTALPAIYGAMLMVNVLFGFIAARVLVLPSRKVVLLLGTVWGISVVVVVLDKPRHAKLVADIREAGARLRLVAEGDVACAVGAASGGVDFVLGIGGTPEGIVAACAVRALGGFMQGRLAPQTSEQETAALAAGHDLERILELDDLVSGDCVLFVSTAV